MRFERPKNDNERALDERSRPWRSANRRFAERTRERAKAGWLVEVVYGFVLCARSGISRELVRMRWECIRCDDFASDLGEDVPRCGRTIVQMMKHRGMVASRMRVGVVHVGWLVGRSVGLPCLGMDGWME